MRALATAYLVLVFVACADTHAGSDAQHASDARRVDASQDRPDLSSYPDATVSDDIADADIAAIAPDASACGTTLSATCSGSLSETACGAAGGLYMERLNPNCACPTPDVGCPCDDSDDCVGLCVDRSVHSPQACRTVRSGVCSEYTNVASCACILGPVVGLGVGEPGYRCL